MMSFAVSAFQSFRTCTASLSSRTLACSSVRCPSRRLAGVDRRYYSEGDASSDTGEAKQAPPKSDEKAEGKCGEVEGKLKAKEAEVVDLTGRLRYLQADFLNLQRNAAREKEQTRDFAITRFASDLLETVDVLAIALKTVPSTALSPSESSSTQSNSSSTQSNSSSTQSNSSSTQSNSSSSSSDAPTTKSYQAHLQELHTGVEMTHRLLLQTLFKYHVKPFDPTGDKFDPNHHEALYQAPIPGKEPGTVIDCQKIGYKIKDRVLRAAQVGVAQDTS